ncbi:H-NS histone family protein [Pusillimonas sp. MFBS29]|uniref:H-NS histone family protein n=1 Tax=Pusillimonas sp. MFBS29 TaxID=2886690 RepID=UPI001D10771A|nr:H-NS histone family protein [Pusillimonas sp. MFBS29]MCC2597508.1 H-NS histone family protein [Pusillimonas sp. MFBS29]
MTRDNYSALKQKIEKEIVKLQKQAQALQAKQRGPVITSIIRSMREYDITPEDIAAAYKQKTTPRTSTATRTTKAAAGPAVKRTVPAKYRHPETNETWTGRGKAPRWITNAEAEGKSRDQFLIANS